MRRIAGALSRPEAGRLGAGAEPGTGAEGARRLRRFAFIALAATLLAAATAAVQLGPWRYQPAPGAAVALDDYRAAGAPWFTSRRGATFDRSVETPEVALTGGPGLAFAARWIRPVPGAAYTRVTVDFTLDGVTENIRNLGASIAVVSFGRDGQRLRHWPRELFKGSGSSPWRSASLVVPWSEQVGVMRLELIVAGEHGEMKLRRIAIAPMVDAAWYAWAHRALVVGWTLLGLVVVTLALRHGRPRYAALATTAAALFIAVGGVLPEPLFDRLTAPMERPISAAGRILGGPAPTATATPRAPEPPAPAAAQTQAQSQPATQTPTTAPASAESTGAAEPESGAAPPAPNLLDLSREAAAWARQAVSHNIIHAGGFGGLAILVAFVAPPVGLLHLAGLAGFAGITETLQMLTVTRGANLEDIIVDWLSALAGLAIGTAIRLSLARRRAAR